MNPTNAIGKKLWEYVKENPTSANKIAKACGVHHSTVLLLLRGQKTVQMETAIKIEKFLKEKLAENDAKNIL